MFFVCMTSQWKYELFHALLFVTNSISDYVRQPFPTHMYYPPLLSHRIITCPSDHLIVKHINVV